MSERVFAQGGYKVPYAEFTPQMRKEGYKILTPDIFPLHLKLVREVFAQYGYALEVLNYSGRGIIEKGLENVHNDMCYPLICVAGQQLHALACGDYDPRKVALIQFQTGGGCRASNYIWMLRKALANSGMDYVPVISLTFSNVEKCSGFRLSLPFVLRGFASIIYGDMLMLLRNQVAPYEVEKGESDRLVDRWVDRLAAGFRDRKRVLGTSLGRNLREIAEDFAAIRQHRRKKIKVGIIGEIYVKYAPFGNNNLQAFLEEEGCEVMVPGVFSFFQYIFQNRINDHKSYGLNSRMSTVMSRFILKKMKKIEAVFAAALDGLPFVKPAGFDKLVSYAQKVFDTHVEMGEGWLLTAEAAELVESGYGNIISVQPFGCLPNHIIARGFSRKFRQIYPQSSLCPLDYDSSQAVVNQENRIKLMLALARDRDGGLQGGSGNENRA